MLKVDHVVIKVPELDEAMAAYTAAGFTVTRGGEHPAFGSVNALIPFADDSYLELIAFPNADNAIPPEGTGQRMATWIRLPMGIIDWAVVPDDIEAEIKRLRKAGQTWSDPMAGQRHRPDGEVVRWLTGAPASPTVPFLCADVTERSLRVPLGEARKHTNGAAGIARLTLAAPTPEIAEALHVLLARSPLPDSPVSEITFPLGSTLIALDTESTTLMGITGMELIGWSQPLP